jgi:D-alanyl-lipoteichoic acid acyltransferase DltB (MBOAT superfamily)
MLFNSLQFAVFFPVVCCLYFSAPQRLRLPLLLLASCAFYMAFIPGYILILLVTILIDYFAGMYIETTSGHAKKAWLITSIISTCAVLFVFKYFDFVTGNFVALFNALGLHVRKPVLSIILPIGLSFHTFQSLSYVVEVYRGNQKAERDFVVYSTYVMFFPQLVAGPIERPQNLIHQFYERHRFDSERIVAGLQRMAWGFFKKLVVADRLALYVNDVYAAPQNFNGLQITLATYFFAYQIYCDFSGYSDIALGAAQVLGFKLMENFRTPYYSKSISEFWQRWHISLSSWFRDYMYNSMASSLLSPLGWIVTILVTFGVSGLWHGANWTYVIWGLLNGFYLLAGAATENARNKTYAWLGVAETGRLRTAIRIACTFFLTCIGWVVFRAKNVQDIWYILTHFLSHWDFHSIRTQQFLMRQMPAAIAGIIIVEAGQLINQKISIIGFVRQRSVFPRWVAYAAFVFAIILFGVFRSRQFIYFQF